MEERLGEMRKGNPTSSIFAFILKAFFFTCFCPFFHKIFLQVSIQEAGEGTSPILSFLHPFVMIWNKKLSAESDIWYNISCKKGTE